MGRLFWKLFISFWLTTVLISLGVAWGTVHLYQYTESLQRHSPTRLIRAQRRVATQIEMVAAVLKHGGPVAARALLLEQALPLRLNDEQQREPLDRSPAPLPESDSGSLPTRMVRAADGQLYRISAEATALRRLPRRFRSPPNLFRLLRHRPELFALRTGLALMISGLVCGWLAWYLVRPVRRLRTASQRFSEGDLSVRVADAMGRRRDEIADLGKDFDQMAERIEALVTAHRQLLGDVSHELRSPLARLHIALGLARKKSSTTISPQLDRIEREAERLDQLIGEVLALTRMDAGAVPLDGLIDLVPLLREITQDAAFEASERDYKVQFDGCGSIVVCGNAELLHRAFENIIRNAIHYTAPESTVKVTLTNPPDRSDWVELSVSDRGPGVAEHQLPRLFEPFFRVARSRSRSSGGHGLGLAITKRAIELHHGVVRADNRPGGGLTITVQLPACTDP